MNANPSLIQRYPAGCFIGFNAGIDRRAAEQLVMVTVDARNNGYKEINLCLSSTGGILDHAYYAVSVLDALGVRLITYNIGNIASAANLIFLCGHDRVAIEDSTFMYHQTSFGPASGEVTEDFASKRLKGIQEDDRRSARIVAKKTGRTVKEVLGWQRRGLVHNTASAIKNGIIHRVGVLNIPPEAFFHQIVM